MMSKLWKDEAGFLVSAELIFVATILVIGLVTGLVAVRNAVTSELTEVGLAIASVDQGYSYNGLSYCGSQSNGSAATDTAGTATRTAPAPAVSGINITVCP